MHAHIQNYVYSIQRTHGVADENCVHWTVLGQCDMNIYRSWTKHEQKKKRKIRNTCDKRNKTHKSMNECVNTLKWGKMMVVKKDRNRARVSRSSNDGYTIWQRGSENEYHCQHKTIAKHSQQLKGALNTIAASLTIFRNTETHAKFVIPFRFSTLFSHSGWFVAHWLDETIRLENNMSRIIAI